MKKVFCKLMPMLIMLSIVVSFSGCGSSEKGTTEDSSETEKQTTNETFGGQAEAVVGLPDGFPSEIPLYSGAQIIDADNFNVNNYTVLYVVNEEYDKIVDFYTEAFDLDESVKGETESYYEGIEFGDILLKGLTIEDTGDSVNVFITAQDKRQG